MDYKPQDIKSFLSNDQFRLYQLIWNRFVACQMNPAVFDQMTIDIAAANYLFRAQGSVMKFPGFTIVYTEGKEDNGEENGFGKLCPPFAKGKPLKLSRSSRNRNSPSRRPGISEASLVRKLEEEGHRPPQHLCDDPPPSRTGNTSGWKRGSSSPPTSASW